MLVPLSALSKIPPPNQDIGLRTSLHELCLNFLKPKDMVRLSDSSVTSLLIDHIADLTSVINGGFPYNCVAPQVFTYYGLYDRPQYSLRIDRYTSEDEGSLNYIGEYSLVQFDGLRLFVQAEFDTSSQIHGIARTPSERIEEAIWTDEDGIPDEKIDALVMLLEIDGS